MDVSLLPDERIDEINEYLSVIQKKDGLTFTSDAYLLAAFVSGKHRRCAIWGAVRALSLCCAPRKEKPKRFSPPKFRRNLPVLSRATPSLIPFRTR